MGGMSDNIILGAMLSDTLSGEGALGNTIPGNDNPRLVWIALNQINPSCR